MNSTARSSVFSRMPNEVSPRLGRAAKLRLGLRVVSAYLLVRWKIRREPLPALVDRITTMHSQAGPRQHPRRLSRAVDRILRIGRRQPTCLVSSLVLFKLLREQGDPAEIVIGLPDSPSDKDAHAWVELDGVDVGPPPGKSGHAEMARFA
jgi:hypothetical protein